MVKTNEGLFWVALLLLFLIGSGCTETKHVVIAATETTIGVNLSQSPATSSPQAKLGYNRAEIALVPSNRNMGTDSKGSLGNGAPDVPDVMMELRYGGIFDVGSSSGIYQRLAVGNTAVKQPGASLMFAKDNAGTVSAESAKALEAVKALPAPPEPVLNDKSRLASAYRQLKMDKTLSEEERKGKLKVFTDAATAAGYTVNSEEVQQNMDAFMKFLADTHTDSDKVTSVKKAIESKGITIK